MRLRKCGLLGDPQPTRNWRTHAPQSHAQLPRAAFTIVDRAQTLTFASASRQIFLLLKSSVARLRFRAEA